VIALLRTVWERLSLYLPVVLMGVLALGTYWLVESTPNLIAPKPESLVRHEPDYFMRNFSIRTYDGTGRVENEVTGTEARHYPDVDSLEIDAVRIRTFDELGRLTTATATRALTHGDVSEVRLFGDARIVRESELDKDGVLQPRMEFRGEFLHAFLNTRRVTSHLPVQLMRGSDQFTGDAMEVDHGERVFVLKGRVRGTLLPQRGR
jgi:lipopolysaccharide export system protein LptC